MYHLYIRKLIFVHPPPKKKYIKFNNSNLICIKIFEKYCASLFDSRKIETLIEDIT